MLFSTPFFIFVFLPILFSLYWLLPSRRYILLLGSLTFYAWSEFVFVWVVLASALFDWVLGRLLHESDRDDLKRKWLVALGVISNLSLLVYAKYTAFLVLNINSVMALFSAPGWEIPQIALPLGVSFIVFEKITYVVDIYRHSVKPAASFVDYLNYVFLFPKLLAGPIVKYHDIDQQLRHPSHCYEDVRDGAMRFIIGLSKKVLIADELSPSTDAVFQLSPHELTTSSAWFGLLCFTLQIYFDFSGYSDMAIGLARILGFRLMENFNHPYLATSFTDFWRRWHISLSTWIKEYLYVPLGGSRVSVARGYLNLIICFLLSGLWHGAAWNFVIWGCYHGVMLIVDRAFWLRWQKVLPSPVNTFLCFILVMLGWVFFRCDTFGHSLAFLAALAGRGSGSLSNHIFIENDINATFIVLLAGLLIIFAPALDLSRLKGKVLVWRSPTVAGHLALFGLCVGRMAVSTFHPFLYFRF